MIKKTSFSLLTVAVCLFCLSACSISPKMGEAPADQPPQLVAGTERDASGRVIYQWDRPSAFGKLDGERKVLGDAACLMGRPDLEALGYHPKAKDEQGQPIQGGGYFCVVKARGDQPGSEAPMLVRTKGVLGWNQPGLFGAVPGAHKARGDSICAKSQPGFEAIAFHPAAKDEAGKPVPGGGFFCAPKRNGARAFG